MDKALKCTIPACSAEPAAILIHARGPRARLPQLERAIWSKSICKQFNQWFFTIPQALRYQCIALRYQCIALRYQRTALRYQCIALRYQCIAL